MHFIFNFEIFAIQSECIQNIIFIFHMQKSLLAKNFLFSLAFSCIHILHYGSNFCPQQFLFICFNFFAVLHVRPVEREKKVRNTDIYIIHYDTANVHGFYHFTNWRSLLHALENKHSQIHFEIATVACIFVLWISSAVVVVVCCVLVWFHWK